MKIQLSNRPYFALSIVLGLLPVVFSGCGISKNSLQVLPTRSPEPIAYRVNSKDGMENVFIPAGEFLMGSTSDEIERMMEQCSYCSSNWGKDEMPQHKVYLDAFWIDKTEVTNAMFARFVAETSYKTDAEIIGCGIGFNLLSRDWKMIQGANWQHPGGPSTDIIGLDNHPVVQTTYNDAQTYCQWAGKRLPTEAEWEKAARGTDGRIFPWGNQQPAGNLLNFADRNAYEMEADLNEDDGYTFTAPVGNYPDGASPYGVLDMSGNVWERVVDIYSDTYYTNSPSHNPTGPSSGDFVIIRGGSWSRMDRYLRVAGRYRYRRENRSSGLGFRCAKSVSMTASTPTSETFQPIQTSQTPLPLSETIMEDYVISDFGSVHSSINQDANRHLIYGNIPVKTPDPQISSDLAGFLGRWEGYSYGPPVKKDWKFVLVINEINSLGGKAYLWAGTNLQYPDWIKEIHFRIVPGVNPAIEWQFLDNESESVFTFTFDIAKNILRGSQIGPAAKSGLGTIELNRDRSFIVYKDYIQYLSSKRIYSKEYHNELFPRYYGKGYLVFIPEGYEDDPQKVWPLIVFLHGSGDRGDNVYLLAKASPFMMIREKGPLPFIIVAPLLGTSQYYGSFPDNYMKGVLDEALADYRIDQKRIYVTGLSMGGEATYRFALLQPQRFAAIAPLSAYLNSSLPMEGIRNLPVWAIHGANDPVIPLSVGQRPFDALKQAGGNVKFSVLENHDHDTWTDTYLDPQFYEWLLHHKKP